LEQGKIIEQYTHHNSNNTVHKCCVKNCDIFFAENRTHPTISPKHWKKKHQQKVQQKGHMQLQRQSLTQKKSLPKNECVCQQMGHSKGP